MKRYEEYYNSGCQQIAGWSIDSEWTEYQIPQHVIDFIRDELKAINRMTDDEIYLQYNVDYHDEAIIGCLEYYYDSEEYGVWDDYIEELTERNAIDFNPREVEKRIFENLKTLITK